MQSHENEKNPAAILADTAANEAAEDSEKIDAPVEPPKVYIASCGTLCDVFWWARRRSD